MNKLVETIIKLNYIISETDDEVTDNVMAWLISNGIDIVRLNYGSVENLFSFNVSPDNIIFQINNSVTDKVWNRRARFNFLDYNKVDSETYNYLKQENETLIKTIEIYLKENSEYVGSWLKEIENYKLTQLLCAKKNGLVIPETIITNSKEELLSFYNKHKNIITKDLRYPVNIRNNEIQYTSKGIMQVTKEMILSLDDVFAPMLFQKKTEKQFEVRVFFFKEKYYSMAIFSQSNSKTVLDYRNYDESNPNRNVPINLPNNLLQKIKQFTTDYELNSGSFDFIYSTSDEFVFLEVNPQGQLEWLSTNCNYYIEKDISDFFKN